MAKRVVATLILALLGLAIPSAAQAGWSTPVSISGAGLPTSQTDIAGGTDGTSWVVWKRNVAGFDVIQGTRVLADGTQGPIVTFSAANQTSTDPAVVARPDGSAMVGWINTSGASDWVQTASIASDGTVGPATDRSETLPAGQDAQSFALALAPDGSAGVVWTRDAAGSSYVQGVRVGSDGSSGAIQNLSDPTDGSAGVPAIGASPTNTFQTIWPQGAGDTANIFGREILSDGSVSELAQVLWPREQPSGSTDPTGIGTGGDPHDLAVVYGTDGIATMGWIRYRTELNPADATPFSSWAVEQVRGSLAPNSAPNIVALTPMVAGDPIVVDDLRMIAPDGALPMVMWKRDLVLGSVFESVRYISQGRTTGWGSAASGLVGVTDPEFAANKNFVGIIGWEQPLGLTSSWTRFSNTALVDYSPAGFISVTDPGFAVANSNVTLAAFTGNTGGVTSSMISIYTSPMIAAAPNQAKFGRVNLGFSSGTTVTIRSSGETPGEVTGVALGGADTGDFALSGDSACVKRIDAGANCTFSVRFAPQSAGSKSAQVTIQSPSGNRVVQLSGSGGTGTRLSASAKPGSKGLRAGKAVSINLKVKNLGASPAKNVMACADLNKRALRLGGKRCRSLGNVAANGTRNVKFRVRVTRRAKRGTVYPVTIRVRANNAVVRLAQTKLRRKGR